MNYSVAIRNLVGFEPNGEFRIPQLGESYITPFGLVCLATYQMADARIILRKIYCKEIPPDGFRFVTKYEIDTCNKPDHDIFYWNEVTKKWSKTRRILWSAGLIYSVHNNVVLEPSLSKEIAPHGFRLVTDHEKDTTLKPDCAMLWNTILLTWDECSDEHKTKQIWFACDSYAIGLEISLEPKAIEITMADVESAFGRKVKIVK